MRTEERICRLCLKICDNFEAIEGNMKGILGIVLPKIVWAAIQKPVMCMNCTKMLMKCFDFKAECFYAHDYIFPFINDKDHVKLDLKDVYLMKNENITGVPEDQDICGFCMNSVKNCSAILLDVDDGDVRLKKMIEQCLPELDISVIRKPVICAPCRCSLENCFHFLTNCLTVEGRIKKYCETLDINSKSQIELSSFLHFTTNNVTINEVDINSLDVINVEQEYAEEIEHADEKKNWNKHNLFKLEPMFCEEGKLEMEDQAFVTKEEIEIKTDQQDFDSFQEASAKLNEKNCFNEMESIHKHPSMTTLFKCVLCVFETTSSQVLNHHKLTHTSEMFKCNICTFKTNDKSCLEAHLLIHERPSEGTNYNCKMGAFKAKRESAINRHMLIHKCSSEITVYKCETCTFETIYKHIIKRHKLNHKYLLEDQKFICEICEFTTRRKDNLQRHILTHQSPSVVTMFKCNVCPFYSRFKHSLVRHMLIHNRSFGGDKRGRV